MKIDAFSDDEKELKEKAVKFIASPISDAGFFDDFTGKNLRN